MTDITTLNIAENGFLFRFEDKQTAHGMFREKSGLIEVVANVDMSAKEPRWATVEKIGPDVRDPALVPGARVLIEALRWSLAIKLSDGSSVWKSDESNVLAIEE
jgi:hypothetical protein